MLDLLLSINPVRKNSLNSSRVASSPSGQDAGRVMSEISVVISISNGSINKGMSQYIRT